MKKIADAITLAIGLCFCHGASLWAAETGWESNSYLIDWLFLIFCALIVVFMVSVVRTILLHIPKRHKKDMLQRYFHKWLAH